MKLWAVYRIPLPRPMERSICPVKVPRAPTRRGFLFAEGALEGGGGGELVGFLVERWENTFMFQRGYFCSDEDILLDPKRKPNK